MQTRRIFLRNAALAMVGAGSAPAWLWRALEAAPSSAGRKKTLVAIFQRGAADGLNIVAPFGEKRYYELRPTIAVPGPSSSDEHTALDLDGFFGLHPSLAPLKPLYDSQHLAIVHAVGSPDPTRSHFDAQDYMESGTPGRKSTAAGWMNRALPRETGPASPLRAVSLGPRLPRSMRGSNPAAAIENLNSFRLRDAGSAGVLETMYAGTTDTVLQGAGRETFEAVKLLESLQRESYTPGAEYPRGPLGENLQQIARLIKAQVGVELAFADVGGWDHHANEVGANLSQGPLANRLRDLGQALAAFWKDLGDHMESVVLVTMSEFGRTARENGNRGTDHGHANVMFALGGPVRGGKVYGDWPGLAPEQLYEGRDLNLTTDFRDVLGELVTMHLGNPEVGSVFPSYVSSPAKYRRLLRA